MAGPKQPKLRPSYRSDAKYFRRLAHAIEADQSQDPEWVRRTLSIIGDLVGQFEAVSGGQEGEAHQEGAQAQTGVREEDAGG